jgi:PAS domain S-box-containing protein
MSRRIWQILIADDSAEDRAQIRRLLLQGSEDQLIFTEAVLGHEAIKAARQSSAPPDCMILDYFLPDMEAPAVLAALRDTDGLAVCPVIVLTGAAGSTLGHDVLRSGAQDFIGKDWLTSGSLVRAMENASQRWMMAGELERGARALALREHELRTLTDNTPEVLSRFDAGFRYVYANAAIARTTGHAPEHFIGHTLQELGMPATVYVPWQHALAGVFATGHPDQLELSEEIAGVRSDQATRFVPEFGVDGEVVSVLTITHDITDRKRLEQALRREDQRKDEFLAILSHELRNPLAALSTGLQVLKAATGSGISVRPVQEMMDRQFRHMIRLVDDLLDVSRISNGRIELKRECIPMQTVLDHAIEANESFMMVAGHKLVLAIDPGPVWVDGDLTRLAQVVGNLLHNAIKYTPHAGQIDLSMRIEGSDVVVSVSDNGAGIPPDMVTHVFDLFTQVEHTLQRAQGGLGIGLGVVAELVALHGGSVTCQSRGLGMGSTFTLRLPAASAPVLSIMPSIAAAPVQAAPADRPSRVLVVDDNVDAADVMAMMLEMHDCHAVTVNTGMDALAASTAFLPDMILLDIGLPDMDGYEVARRLRADPRTAEVILVALTGWGSASDRLRSAAAGFDAHLTKPVEVATILSLLRAPRDVQKDCLPCLT